MAQNDACIFTMQINNSSYIHIGRASDLEGSDRVLYRLLEILPGFLSWGTIIVLILLSFYRPFYAAYFIIAFDLYWLLKTAYLSIHLRHNWKRIRHALSTNWREMCDKLKYEHIIHMVILPYYKEGQEVVEAGIKGILRADFNKKNIAVVLATEERAGVEAQVIAEAVRRKYEKQFGYFIVTKHPANLPGEMPGKGSNISYAAEQARGHILEKNKIPYENVIVSAFDIDTVVYQQYFFCLTWYFLTALDPYKTSFQPVPLYHNNVWQSPAFSRVVAMSSTFWQMIQQERPEKLATFSSHAVSFKSLYEVGYWQRNMVSEDSRIFWNMLIANSGKYTVLPISYPVSMDGNAASTYWQTIKNIYKQHRRWSWGVENVPYILFNFIKDKTIPLKKKIHLGFVQVAGFWSLATNPIIIFMLGWMPVVLGGRKFKSTILSYNLPIFTRDLMILSMIGLVLSAMITLSLLPPAPEDSKKRTKLYMILQWVFVPVTILIFGAIPGLDAQTRLMTGRYMGFWVTPKYRK